MLLLYETGLGFTALLLPLPECWIYSTLLFLSKSDVCSEYLMLCQTCPWYSDFRPLSCFAVGTSWGSEAVLTQLHAISHAAALRMCLQQEASQRPPPSTCLGWDKKTLTAEDGSAGEPRSISSGWFLLACSSLVYEYTNILLVCTWIVSSLKWLKRCSCGRPCTDASGCIYLHSLYLGLVPARHDSGILQRQWILPNSFPKWLYQLAFLSAMLENPSPVVVMIFFSLIFAFWVWIATFPCGYSFHFPDEY